MGGQCSDFHPGRFSSNTPPHSGPDLLTWQSWMPGLAKATQTAPLLLSYDMGIVQNVVTQKAHISRIEECGSDGFRGICGNSILDRVIDSSGPVLAKVSHSSSKQETGQKVRKKHLPIQSTLGIAIPRLALSTPAGITLVMYSKMLQITTLFLSIFQIKAIFALFKTELSPQPNTLSNQQCATASLPGDPHITLL